MDSASVRKIGAAIWKLVAASIMCKKLKLFPSSGGPCHKIAAHTIIELTRFRQTGWSRYFRLLQLNACATSEIFHPLNNGWIHILLLEYILEFSVAGMAKIVVYLGNPLSLLKW
jgi:hypothetical protein